MQGKLRGHHIPDGEIQSSMPSLSHKMHWLCSQTQGMFLVLWKTARAHVSEGLIDTVFGSYFTIPEVVLMKLL